MKMCEAHVYKVFLHYKEKRRAGSISKLCAGFCPWPCLASSSRLLRINSRPLANFLWRIFLSFGCISGSVLYLTTHYFPLYNIARFITPNSPHPTLPQLDFMCYTEHRSDFWEILNTWMYLNCLSWVHIFAGVSFLCIELLNFQFITSLTQGKDLSI